MFTVIVTAHDRPQLLRRALRSLSAQAWSDFKVIVVSDNATYLPPYQELAALDGRFTYVIRTGEAGPGASRDAGVALAESPYLMFLDDDDTIEPQHLELMAQAIGESTPDLLYCDFKVLFEDRSVDPPVVTRPPELFSLAAYDPSQIFVRNYLVNSCVMYRREVAAAVRHDPSLRINEDWDFLMSCAKGRVLRYCPFNTVVIHKTSGSAAANARRGNTANDAENVIGTMLKLYQRHKATTYFQQLGRKQLMLRAGVDLPVERY
jgi:glycosyltransferase involved in cell wall biosynthesis